MSGPNWFPRLVGTAPNWAERYATLDGALTDGMLDAATFTEYLAETTPATRAQAVVDALADPVTVRVYNGDGTIMGEGLMQTPWATTASGVVTVGEVAQFLVTQSGTPDPASWYLRFESGTRWVRGSFGLVGSAAACTWSLPAWVAGQNGTIGTITIGVPSGSAPSLVGAPSTLDFTAGVGGTYNFATHGSDPDGGTLTYSVSPSDILGVSMSAAGVFSVSNGAPAVARDYTITVTDSGGLSSSWSCAVTIASDLIRWAPGHYIRPGLGDSLASILTKLATYDSRVKGITLFRYWKDIETAHGVYDWSWYDDVVATCQTYNKRILMRIQDRIFNQTNPALVVPQYVIDAGLSYVTTASPRAGTALWRTAAMDYSIEIYKAMIDRYRNVVSADGKPVLVGTYGEESIFGGVDSVYADYSADGLVTQELRRAYELRAYAPELPYFWLTNWITPHSSHPSTTWTGSLESHAAMERWFAEACRADAGIFTSYGPDTRFINGIQIDGWDHIRGQIGGVDHRGDYAVIGWTEALEWNAGNTAAQIYAGGVTDAGAAIMVWSTNPAQWASDAYPYIATHATNAVVPANLVNRVGVI